MAKKKIEHDWTTRDGRAALDAAALDAVASGLATRHEVGTALDMDMTDRRAANAVTAALARLCASAKAERSGSRGQTRYMVKGKVVQNERA